MRLKRAPSLNAQRVCDYSVQMFSLLGGEKSVWPFEIEKAKDHG